MTNSKLFSIVSYITWVGFIIALVFREKDDRLVSCHLNQALVINIIETIATVMSRLGGILGWLGGIVHLCMLVLLILGIVRAWQGSEEPLPVIGGIRLID